MRTRARRGAATEMADAGVLRRRCRRGRRRAGSQRRSRSELGAPLCGSRPRRLQRTACSHPGSSIRTPTPYSAAPLRRAGAARCRHRLHGDRPARRRDPFLRCRPSRTRSKTSSISLALTRIKKLASYGSTTIEVKSGYGLSLDDEIKSLRVIRASARDVPVRLVPTWLGAHEIPSNHRGAPTGRARLCRAADRRNAPGVSREKLARFADVFCEPGVFTIEETREILTASRAAGPRDKAARRRAGAPWRCGAGGRARRDIGGSSRARSRPGNSGARRIRHCRDATSRHDALPRAAQAGTGASADRRGGGRRSRDGFQSRNVANLQFSVDSDLGVSQLRHDA